MSYSTKEARMELQDAVEQAIHHRDVEVMIALARRYKNMRDDEYADELRSLARKWEQEDWAYDESIDN